MQKYFKFLCSQIHIKVNFSIIDILDNSGPELDYQKLEKKSIKDLEIDEGSYLLFIEKGSDSFKSLKEIDD